ncbi:Fic family protein [Muribaculum intestinale]|uniref:Fic family protein n=1 Tax=Muribaculum intestinale TaxID=1796646 RepID=UPI003978C52A
MEIHSPGALPNGLTVEDIKNVTSMPRNMFLFTNANYLLPYTGAGSGVRRAIEYDPNAIFSNGQVTNQGNLVPDTSTSELSNNQAQPEISIIPNQAEEDSNQHQSKSNQATDSLVTRPLTKKEQDIRNFCSVPRTAQEIMDRLGITNQSKNRQKYITSLIEIGVLERTVPDNLTNPNQKYRRKQ